MYCTLCASHNCEHSDSIKISYASTTNSQNDDFPSLFFHGYTLFITIKNMSPRQVNVYVYDPKFSTTQPAKTWCVQGIFNNIKIEAPYGCAIFVMSVWTNGSEHCPATSEIKIIDQDNVDQPSENFITEQCYITRSQHGLVQVIALKPTVIDEMIKTILQNTVF